MIVCRLWWCYLHTVSTFKSSKGGKITIERKKEINKCFITRPAFLSIELNAQNLMYLVLLVKQKRLPEQALNNIHLFNSQACESLFRDARALTGTFSTKVNFTVKNFLKRSQKLSILTQLKYNQFENSLSFPIHHKHKSGYSSTATYPLDGIDTLDIEMLISNAYDQAIELVKHSKMFDTLNEYNINNLNDISKCIYEILNKNSRMINYSSPTPNEPVDEFGLDEENDDNDDINFTQNQPMNESLCEWPDDYVSDDEDILNSTKSDFEGIRIVDTINPALRQSYFKIKLNGKTKFLHKQSACWLLSNNITKLSSDRLSRVKQQTVDNY